MLTRLFNPVVHGPGCERTLYACCHAWQFWEQKSNRHPAVQANAQLDGLGDHSKLYSENDQAEQQQRKLSREQASLSLSDSALIC